MEDEDKKIEKLFEINEQKDQIEPTKLLRIHTHAERNSKEIHQIT